MIRTITTPVCSRPKLFREMLNSLRKNNTNGFVLHVGIEPTPQADEMEALVRSIDWIETKAWINPRRLGVNWNNHALLDRVFSSGSVFNVYLEEDILLAPDAFDLARWYEKNAGEERELFLGFVGHNYKSDPSRPLEVARTWYFTPIGWCCTADAWNSFFKPNWMNDERGWDWSIATALQKIKGRSLHPFLSRSTHTGREGGVHCSVEHHDNVFSGLVLSSGSYGADFVRTGDWNFD